MKKETADKLCLGLTLLIGILGLVANGFKVLDCFNKLRNNFRK